MKRLILFAAISVISFTSVAQITLTATTSNPLPGDTAFIYQIGNGNQGGSGPSVTWSFTGLTPSQLDTFYYSPIGTPCSDPFPLFSTPGTYPCLRENYLANNDSLAYEAQSGYQYIIGYSDPRLELIYPLTYGQSIYLDSFKATHTSSGSDFDILGWEYLSADAYGTLNLPNATYNNVLRVRKTITTGYRPFQSSSAYSYTTNDVYEWYSATSRTPVLRMTNNVNLNVAGVQGSNDDIAIFPNPASNHLTIYLRSVSAEGIMLYDITGKLVNAVTGTKNKTTYSIDVQGLAPGLYMLHIATETGNIVKKVHVQM